MLQQHTLKPRKGALKKKSKRVGRGDGSGMGTYATRGVKGQNARTGGGVRPGFEGGQTQLSRRLPKLKGFKNATKIVFQAVNLKDLCKLDAGTEINVESLHAAGLVKKKNRPVKILGIGELDKKLTLKVDAVSKSAKTVIEKAGGSIELIVKKVARGAVPKKDRKNAKIDAEATTKETSDA